MHRGLHVGQHRAGLPADGCCFRCRRLPGARGSRRLVRVSELRDGGPARRERARKPRPRQERHPEFGLRVSAAQDYGEPCPGRRSQGRRLVRPADCAWHSCRVRGRRAPAHCRRGPARRAVAGRIDSPRAGNPSDRRGRPARWCLRNPAAGGECLRGGHRFGPRCAAGLLACRRRPGSERSVNRSGTASAAASDSADGGPRPR